MGNEVSSARAAASKTASGVSQKNGGVSSINIPTLRYRAASWFARGRIADLGNSTLKTSDIDSKRMLIRSNRARGGKTLCQCYLC